MAVRAIRRAAEVSDKVSGGCMTGAGFTAPDLRRVPGVHGTQPASLHIIGRDSLQQAQIAGQSLHAGGCMHRICTNIVERARNAGCSNGYIAHRTLEERAFCMSGVCAALEKSKFWGERYAGQAETTTGRAR